MGAFSRVALTLCLLSPSFAFNVPAPKNLVKVQAVQGLNLFDKKTVQELELTYGEQSRPYRRDFFTHEEWVRHRAPYRFTKNLTNMIKSGVVRQLIDEVFLLSMVAAVVCFYNTFFVEGFVDWNHVQHSPLISGLPQMSMPITPFTLSTPSLGLLLVFRTNVSYQRWDEARKAWGVVVNNSRTIARQTASWLQQSNLPQEEKERLLRRVTNAVWAFPRSLARHLLSAREDELDFQREVRAKLPEPFATDLINARRHRPSRALFEMSAAINELPIEYYRRISIDESVSHLADAMGGCDRIYTSPVPLVYTRHTARFLELWLLFLPLALYPTFASSWNHWFMVPSTAIITFFLLGVEELSIQLEEPFSVLPLHKIAAGIGASAEEHNDWNFKDEQIKAMSPADSQQSNLPSWNS